MAWRDYLSATMVQRSDLVPRGFSVDQIIDT